MRIAICDDDKRFIDLFCEYFNNYDHEHLIYTYTDTVQFMDHLSNSNYDCVFLDIEMPQKSGLEIAQLLNATCNEALVIFVTSHTKYAIQGYKFNVFRFIDKSSFTFDIKSVLEDIKEHFRRKISINILTLTYKEHTYALDISKIIYCMSLNRYIIIGTDDKTYKFRVAIKDIKERLFSNNFVEVYQGVLVNVAYVEKLSITEGIVYLSNGRKIHGSKKGLKKLRGILNES